MRYTRILMVFTLVFVTAFSMNVEAQRRRAVAHPSPAINFSGAIAAEKYQHPISATETVEAWRISFHAFNLPAFPVGSTMEKFILNPSGEVYATFDATTVDPWDPVYPFWQGWIWNGPLPETWTSGYATFGTNLTIYGKKYRIFAKVPVKMPEDTKTGPLDHVVVDAAGGILIVGNFLTSPVAVAPRYLNKPVPVQDGVYILPGAVPLPTLLVVSSGVNGNPQELESSSIMVNMPE